MFENYAEEEDCLGMEGLCGLCEAVGIDPETDVRLLCLCWRVGAKKPSMILREEWNEGMCRLRLDSLEKLKKIRTGGIVRPDELGAKPVPGLLQVHLFVFPR